MCPAPAGAKGQSGKARAFCAEPPCLLHRRRGDNPTCGHSCSYLQPELVFPHPNSGTQIPCAKRKNAEKREDAVSFPHYPQLINLRTGSNATRNPLPRCHYSTNSHLLPCFLVPFFSTSPHPLPPPPRGARAIHRVGASAVTEWHEAGWGGRGWITRT